MLIFALLLFQATGTVTLAWIASAPPSACCSLVPIPVDCYSCGVAIGYRVYYGFASNNYSSEYDAGNVTQCDVTGLALGRRYYFTVRAYAADGSLSDYSNEVFTCVAGSLAPCPVMLDLINVTYGRNPNEKIFDRAASPVPADHRVGADEDGKSLAH